ncbi:MAG: hypothetical protein Tsb0032_00330 [Kiloniellaceae bacterium]
MARGWKGVAVRRGNFRVIQHHPLNLRFGVTALLTAVLLAAFFGRVFFELYGVSEFCRQKYDLPPFSFYFRRFDCFIAAGDLAAKMAQIFALVAGPLLVASVTPLWVDWPRRGAGPSGRHLDPHRNGSRDRTDVVSEAQLWFWVLTAALGIALVGGLVSCAVGLWPASPDQAIGSALIYGLHLYPAGILVFCAMETAGWLCRVFSSRWARAR